MRLPLQNPKPDIGWFLRVIKGEEEPKRPPLVELFVDHEVVREISRSYLGHEWVEPSPDPDVNSKFLANWIDVYYRMGYDYVRMSGGLDFPVKLRLADDTVSDMSRGQRGWVEEGSGIIASWEDFEKYPWPDPAKSDLSGYEYVANNLPEGMGLFVCPTSGFLEIPLDCLLGYEGMCYLLYDDPKLVAAVFERVGEIITGFYKRLIGLPNLVGFFQGDDMGYKTSTMIGANDLRKYVFPWHKQLTTLAHENGLVYLLHSCGHLDEVMEDLISDVGIDGRHSYEEEGNPVIEFKRRYGDRIAVLGGIDVDRLCRLPEPELRAYVRNVIDNCLPSGRFAVGSGNTVCNYVSIPNYFAMVEEALEYGE